MVSAAFKCLPHLTMAAWLYIPVCMIVEVVGVKRGKATLDKTVPGTDGVLTDDVDDDNADNDTDNDDDNMAFPSVDEADESCPYMCLDFA